MNSKESQYEQENIIIEGLCNKVKNWLLVQYGYAILTDKRFIYFKRRLVKAFMADKYVNLRHGNFDIDISLVNITNIEDGKCGINKTIIIKTKDNKTYNFYIFNREEWKASLQHAIEHNYSITPDLPITVKYDNYDVPSPKKQILKQTNLQNAIEHNYSITPDFPITVKYGNYDVPSPKEQILKQTNGKIDLQENYVCISTSGDEAVCPMCAQFEGKYFPKKNAPKLPLCPSCSCAYEYYDKQDLPVGAVISNIEDFTLPAECTSLFYKHQQDLYDETDTARVIRICVRDLKKLPDFMAPYLSAGFSAPAELVCRDLLPELYMQLGQWSKAENTIKTCISAKAYYPEDGSEELSRFEAYKKVATETLAYISQNPGCLQRNIYKAMGYENDEKEILKQFLRDSLQIQKVKHNNTNQLFVKSDDEKNNKTE